MMRVSFDLDNTIFNLNDLYVKACYKFDTKYYHPTDWDIYNCYPRQVANELHRLFRSEDLYKTSLLDAKLPYALNSIYKHPNYKSYFITERANCCSEKDRQQLLNAGIICEPDRIIDHNPKIEALKNQQIELHFDDAPHVIQDCIENHIDCVMISNDNTPYNHRMRDYVEHYPSLMIALKKRGLIR